jgi:hypothetical protein
MDQPRITSRNEWLPTRKLYWERDEDGLTHTMAWVRHHDKCDNMGAS